MEHKGRTLVGGTFGFDWRGARNVLEPFVAAWDGIDTGAVQSSPLRLVAKGLIGGLRVYFFARGSPSKQTIKGNRDGRCDRNCNPPVHVTPPTEALRLPRC